jgi:hypothetical protein
MPACVCAYRIVSFSGYPNGNCVPLPASSLDCLCVHEVRRMHHPRYGIEIFKCQNASATLQGFESVSPQLGKRYGYGHELGHDGPDHARERVGILAGLVTFMGKHG